MISICDVHCHILPGMDDGCADLTETLHVLQTAREQGVYDLIATPHFYSNHERIETFLQRRDTAFASLSPHVPEDMRICLGAEVAYFSGISRYENIEQLCLGQSRLMLLELPFSPWDGNVVRELYNLICIRGITPVLAHIERYLSIQPRDILRKILALDVLVQMNAENLLHYIPAFHARRLLRSGIVQLLGSDCHNTTDRSFCLGKAAEHLKKYGMSRHLRYAANMSQEIFQKALGE